MVHFNMIFLATLFSMSYRCAYGDHMRGDFIDEDIDFASEVEYALESYGKNTWAPTTIGDFLWYHIPCKNPGARHWISVKWLKYVGHELLPALVASLPTIPIKDIHVNTGNTSNTTFDLSEIRLYNFGLFDGPTFEFVEGVGIQFSDVHFKLNVSATYNLTNQNGSAVGIIETGVIEPTIFEGIIGLGMADGKPEIAVNITELNISLDHISVTPDVAGIEQKLNDNSAMIIDAVLEMVLEGVKQFVNKTDEVFKNSDFQVKLPLPSPYDRLALDVSPCSINVGEFGLSVDLNGDILDTQGNVSYYGNATTLPDRPTDAYGMAVTDFSPFTFNSGLSILYQLGLFSVVIPEEKFPKGFKLDIPALANAVGHKGVEGLFEKLSVNISAISAPLVEFKERMAQLTTDIQLHFFLGRLPILKIQIPVKSGITVKIRGRDQVRVLMRLRRFNFQQIAIVAACGEYKMRLVKLFVNSFLHLVFKPLANLWLHTHQVKLPKFVESTKLGIHDDYVEVVSDFHVTPAEVVQKIEHAFD